ncbi:MAG: FtsQ-type POTRA domain-containing protein [Myxococcota bacterium]|nr:FtsQ-type POTRA domain-containing protein [Myxococcota bacterium]
MSPLLPPPPTLRTRVRQVLTWTASIAAFSVTSWFVVDQIAHGRTFQVSTVEFVGNERAEAVQLRHLADVKHGVHLFNADLGRAVRGVEQHPWVKHATARRKFPGAIEIRVEEHRPVMLLAIGDLWLVDDSARVFKRADSNILDFPVLSGVNPELFETHPAVANAIVSQGLGVYTAVATDPQLAESDVSEIHFDERTGFELVLRSGTEVVIGFTNPSAAFDRLRRMRDQGLDLNSPQRVDLDVGSVAIATPLP